MYNIEKYVVYICSFLCVSNFARGGSTTWEILSPQNLILYLLAFKFFNSDLAIKRY